MRHGEKQSKEVTIGSSFSKHALDQEEGSHLQFMASEYILKLSMALLRVDIVMKV